MCKEESVKGASFTSQCFLYSNYKATLLWTPLSVGSETGGCTDGPRGPPNEHKNDWVQPRRLSPDTPPSVNFLWRQELNARSVHRSKGSFHIIKIGSNVRCVILLTKERFVIVRVLWIGNIRPTTLQALFTNSYHVIIANVSTQIWAVDYSLYTSFQLSYLWHLSRCLNSPHGICSYRSCLIMYIQLHNVP